MPESNCAFCEIKADNPRVIRFGAEVISFLSRPRIVKGHTLVIPKRHVETPDALTEDEVLAMQTETNRVSALLRNRMGALGIDVWQKHRPLVPEGYGGHKMDHLHTHVLPSVPGQVIYATGIPWAFMIEEPSDREIDEVIKTIRD